MSKYNVLQNISEAETLPAEFYHSESVFNEMKARFFRHSFQWIGDINLTPAKGSFYPFNFMPYFYEEPMLLLRNEDEKIICLSNVCTHRGNILMPQAGKSSFLQCGYHGRKFDLNGRMTFMPEFKEAVNFPRPCDHLHEFPVKQWGPFVFTSITGNRGIQKSLDWMDRKIGFLGLNNLRFDLERSKEYLVHAHWALYCDNYLEGFHIPFVHHDLNQILNYGKYETLTEDDTILQIGYSDIEKECFNLPIGHEDYGKNVAAYYFWIFPNMMFNYYPWGLSINMIRPVKLNRTKVSFLSYIWDETKLNQGAGADPDKVEREDEFVVENVFRGLQSEVYRNGRFSPTKEKGVHHFHRLLANSFG